MLNQSKCSLAVSCLYVSMILSLVAFNVYIDAVFVFLIGLWY